MIQKGLKTFQPLRILKTESKGKDKVESAFFGKFILCSNNENNFILIDEMEIRFWIRKINPLDNVNPNLVSKLESEIPWFVDFLSRRKIQNPKKTRMWFTREQIYTTALSNLMKGTRFHNEKELILLLDEMFDNFEVNELKFTMAICRRSLKNQRLELLDVNSIIF